MTTRAMDSYRIPGVCIAIGFLSACGPRVDTFAVHGGSPGSSEAVLPIPAPGKNLVAIAKVTPFNSTLGEVTVALKRTEPSVLEPTALTLPLQSTNSTGFLSPSSRTYQLVLPAEQVGLAAGAVIPLEYPSIWEANLSIPYQATPTSGTLTRSLTFQVEAPSRCQSFDREASWRFYGAFKYLPAEGNNQQPRESNRSSTLAAERTETENYPVLISNTGALAVEVTLNTNCHGNDDQCVRSGDQWYGSFSGPLPPRDEGAGSDSLEAMIKGNLTLVQMGAATGPSGGMEWGPPAHYTDAGNGWRHYRGAFVHPVTGAGYGGIRIQAPGYNTDSIFIDLVCRPLQ
jgi:hypothetical protein